MTKVTQIAVLAKVYGNVNADESIGQRVTIKKMYSSDGETHPFVSARAIKYCIRQSLRERGYDIDPFVLAGKRVVDSGDPIKYVDNDLFGFMRAERGTKEIASRRQAPISISYFKAIRDTPVTTELGLRSPRIKGKTPKEVARESRTLLPFQIEVAEFIGRINCLIYDYIGKYAGTESLGKRKIAEKKEFIPTEERRKRLRDFLEIFMTPTYVLPRRTNSLNIPEYFAALVALSEKVSIPIYQYLDYVCENGKPEIDIKQLELLNKRKELKAEMFIIDYQNFVPDKCPIPTTNINEVIKRIVDFMVPEK